MQRRQILLLSALLSAWLGAAAACGPAAPLERPAPEAATPTVTPLPPAATPTASLQEASPLQGHVTIWASWSPQAMRGLNERMESFQAEHPKVAFSLAYIPAEAMRARVEAAYQAGTMPSIYLGPSRWGPSLRESGALMDLGSLITPELQRDLHPLAWSQVSYEGGVLALPMQMHGNVLYRNRRLSAVPAANLRDLLETSRSLQGTTFVGAALDFGFFNTTAHAAACGGSLLTRGSPPAVDGPLGLCWLNLLQALATAGPVVFNTDEDLELFASGGAAWWMGSTELHDALVEAIGRQNLAIDLWPIYEATGGRMAGYVWTENAYFSPDLAGDDLLAAWAFIISQLTPEAQLLFSQSNRGGHIPVLASLKAAGAETAAMHAALQGGAPLPLWAEVETYIETLERAARAVSLQGADPETAQRRAIEELKDLEAEG